MRGRTGFDVRLVRIVPLIEVADKDRWRGRAAPHPTGFHPATFSREGRRIAEGAPRSTRIIAPKTLSPHPVTNSPRHDCAGAFCFAVSADAR